MIDIISFSFALSFISIDTIAPAMVSQVTSSALLVGLVGTVFRGSWLIPQLAIAQAIKKKPYLIPGIIGRIAALGILIAALFSGAAIRSGLLLVIVYASLSLFAISDGIIAVAWFDILARAIPVQRRGRLFGIGQAAGHSVAGAIADSSGTFKPAFLLAGMVAFTGAVGSYFLRACCSRSGN